jgi:hypothetical protein
MPRKRANPIGFVGIEIIKPFEHSGELKFVARRPKPLDDHSPNKIPPVPDKDDPGDDPATKLRDSYVAILGSLTDIIEKPPTFGPPQEDWLELASSLHFLQTKKGMNLEEAREVIQKEKGHLLKYVDQAQEKLREMKLLP